MTPDTGPWRLVGLLRDWVEATTWCEWLELAGSLGRGAGDELSDVDAGLGFNDTLPYEAGRAETFAAIQTLAPVAEAIIQPYGEGFDHLIVQYEDGRQLSLVLFPPRDRGVPPGSLAVFDRSGQPRPPSTPSMLTADADRLREWAFLAWWSLGDVAKHAGRGKPWRALTALDDARGHVWQLYAAALGVDYPGFGAVSVENAGLTAPAGLGRSLPARAEPVAIVAAARALAAVLEPLSVSHDVDGLRAIMRQRLDEDPAAQQG